MPPTLTRAEVQHNKQAAIDTVAEKYDAILDAIDNSTDPCPALVAARDACDDLKQDIIDMMVQAGCST